jgi:CheY-like chemotaxis protein
MTESAPPLVLYVEDDRINILLMEATFADFPGWRLHCVETGREALAQLDALRPTFALIDMGLPDMSGLELLPRLRRCAAGAGLMCVALSADNPPDLVRAAKAAGFAEYWLKPVDLKRLRAALDLAKQA